jgi:hypothetical protein
MRVAIVAVSVLAAAGCLATSACSSSGSGKGSTTSPAASSPAGTSSPAGGSSAASSGPTGGGSNAALCADIEQVSGTLTTLLGAANDPSALKTAIGSAATLLQKLQTDAAGVPSLAPAIQDLGKQFQAAQAAVSASPPDQAALTTAATAVVSDVGTLTTYSSANCK